MLCKSLLVLALILASLSAHAQVATGIYPYSSYDTPGFDSIDRGSLNVHFGIPIVSATGRGLPFEYSLVFDSSVWSPSTSTGTTLWTPDAAFGLHGYLLNDGYKGSLSYSTGQTKCFTSGSQWYFTATANNFVYTDQFGVKHAFYYSYVACNGRTTGNGSTSDGSGFYMDTSYKVHTRAGLSLVLPTFVNGSVSGTSNTITDTNGNQITNNTNGTFTDTKGKTSLTITGSGTASSPKVFTYLTPTSTSAVTLSYKTYTVQTNFGCSGVGDFGPKSIVT